MKKPHIYITLVLLSLIGASYNNLSAGLMGSRPAREEPAQNFFVPGAMNDAQQHDLFTEMQHAFEADPLLALIIKTKNIDSSIMNVLKEAASKADNERAERVEKFAKETFALFLPVDENHTLAQELSSKLGGLINAIHSFPDDCSTAIDIHISVFSRMREYEGFLLAKGSFTHDKILSDAKSEIKEALEALQILRNIEPPFSQKAVAKHLAVIANCWKRVNCLILADILNLLLEYDEKLAEAKKQKAKQPKAKL